MSANAWWQDANGIICAAANEFDDSMLQERHKFEAAARVRSQVIKKVQHQLETPSLDDRRAAVLAALGDVSSCIIFQNTL
jgi:hypothetical protein